MSGIRGILKTVVTGNGSNVSIQIPFFVEIIFFSLMHAVYIMDCMLIPASFTK